MLDLHIRRSKPGVSAVCVEGLQFVLSSTEKTEEYAERTLLICNSLEKLQHVH